MVFDPLPIAPALPLDHAAQRSVDRALSELRRGEAVVATGADGRVGLVLPAERVTAAAIAACGRIAGTAPALAISGQRARALGYELPASEAVLLSLPGGIAAEAARLLADPTLPPVATAGLPRAVATGHALDGSLEGCAVRLVKLARLLPAALLFPMPGPRDGVALARRHDLLAVEGAHAAEYSRQSARTLYRVVEAEVPLADSERTRIVAFRPSDGGPEHLAIVVGTPDPAEPVLVRLHSECFTGDLLGSLRCDCGPQLRGAIREIATAGSGILLYLAQEGRGIGLINKLRAYRLQDGGLDTLDANLALGFGADERIYQPAAAMLRALGHDRVRLMTNNPDKLDQLAACGIAVAERVPHIFPSNGHNAAYLRTKAERAGHLF